MAEVVKQERGKDADIPGKPNGARPEVAHVCVKGLATSDAQDDGAEHEKTMLAVRSEEANRVHGIDSR